MKVNGLRGGQRARHRGIFQASAPAGVWVREVRFEPGRVVVEVALRRRLLVCPECGYRAGGARTSGRSTRSGGTWISGSGGLRSCAAAAVVVPEPWGTHRGRPVRAPRSDSRATSSAWSRGWRPRTDKTTIKRMLRIDWDTVGRIVARVCADELDPGRLDDLYEIGVDEVCWKRQHKYLTLVDRSRARQWCGAPRRREGRDRSPSDPATAVLRRAEPAGHGIPGAAHARSSPRSSARRTAARGLRPERAPRARPAGDRSASTPITSCSSPTRRWTRSAARTGTSSRARRPGGRQALQGLPLVAAERPENLTDEQAATLARIKAAGGEVWRAYALKEAARGDLRARPRPEDVEC